MNFTFHFRLARRDLGSPAAAVGAMLPDLWRIAHRHVRPAIGPVAGATSARVEEMLAGVRHHGRVDSAFHESELFRDGERALAASLAEVGAPRLTLFAHIGWELCLDGALVRREGAPLLAEVRAAVEVAVDSSSGPSAVDAAARAHHAARKEGAPLPDGFDDRMAHLLAAIARGSWIEGYGRGQIVAERIDGIRASLRLARLTSEQRAELETILDAAIGRAGAVLDPLLAMPV